MTRGRILILVVLVALPVLFLVGAGGYHLWATGWAFWAWWPMGLCLAAAYILAWRWQRAIRDRHADAPPPLHWTERDREAWKLVEERVKAARSVTDDQLGDARFYFDTAQQMAEQLARAYRSNAGDPIGQVTVPELLSVIELASHDLNVLATTYVPGSHLMTIDHWRTAHRAVGWYRTATNAYWAAAAVFDPLQTAVRYVAAKYGMGKPLELFQQNVILWFYAAYVRKVGEYLIELYSGRLKVGAKRYRELREHAEGSVPSPDAAKVPESPTSSPVTPGVNIAVIGQVKAGKSSLINALLGERRAATDVLPLTSEVTRYDLAAPGATTRLSLLDTAGYGRAGAEADNLEATAEAVQGADLLFIVSHARNPARKADVDFLARLRGWFRDRPHLKFPPMVAVLTHVDLLTPAMEWAPPYDWSAGTRPKEKSMADAIAAGRESFPDAAEVVPCCTADGRDWGVVEGVLPAVVGQLGEAKSVALLRCLHAEADEGKLRKIFAQLWAASKKAFHHARGGVPS